MKLCKTYLQVLSRERLRISIILCVWEWGGRGEVSLDGGGHDERFLGQHGPTQAGCYEAAVGLPCSLRSKTDCTKAYVFLTANLVSCEHLVFQSGL